MAISVSHHAAALCAPLCRRRRLGSTIQRSQIKPRLITIKQRCKYYAFVPETIIAPVPIRAGSDDECSRQDYDSRHFVSRPLVPLVPLVLLLALLACAVPSEQRRSLPQTCGGAVAHVARLAHSEGDVTVLGASS